MFASVVVSLVASLSVQEQAPSSLDGVISSHSQQYAFQRPNPGIHFSPTGAARYAMQQGCIPHIMTGRPAGEFVSTAASGRRNAAPGQYTISTVVTLKEDPGGSCTIMAARGEPERLRAEMLGVFSEAGATSTVSLDTGVGSRDSNGNFRQELHCLTLNGRPLYLLMSSSTASNRPRLMASLGSDKNGDCATRGSTANRPQAR